MSDPVRPVGIVLRVAEDGAFQLVGEAICRRAFGFSLSDDDGLEPCVEVAIEFGVESCGPFEPTTAAEVPPEHEQCGLPFPELRQRPVSTGVVDEVEITGRCAGGKERPFAFGRSGDPSLEPFGLGSARQCL